MAQSPQQQRTSVLVVEDEPLLRICAADLAKDEGFNVHEAQDADQAILILETYSEITIVITDIYMAGSMDGLQLAAYAHDSWPPLRFIIVSGQCNPTAVDMPPGAIFFTKPYHFDAMRRALRSFAPE